jgi:hypothetical protein
MRAKFINEKFTEDSDPIQDMGIGLPVGAIVYHLEGINLIKAIVEVSGNQRIKIRNVISRRSHFVKIENIAREYEKMCVVWERWKGKRRGYSRYRIEKNIYKNRQKEAKFWPDQALVWEDSYGVENKYIDPRLQ